MAQSRRDWLRTAAATIPAVNSLIRAQSRNRPNVVFILSDDVGYGDLGCYGASRVRTPNLDRLAAEGVRFTDAHSSSATCTPSRYSLMTGEYAWRKKGTNILPGDAALIIDPSRPTLPFVFKQSGYRTGCVGKWHLGLGAGQIDWNADIRPGPLELGFDYSFIFPATADRVPCVYIENHRVVGLDPRDPIQVSYGKPIGADPTGREHPELLKMTADEEHNDTIVDGIARIGYMSGGHTARWVDEDMAATFTRQAVSFIERNQAQPFFLYFAPSDIHVPRVPNGTFRGASHCGRRCDAIEQLDWTVGEVLNTLDRLKLAENTLLVFTSDNGPVVKDGYEDGSVQAINGHVPAGPFRGGKYSLYEGGTRLPFLARWPRHIRAGVSDALIGQVDIVASMAGLVGETLPKDAAPDSLNLLPVLLGQSQHGRDYIVEHATHLALRKQNWKLLPRSDAPTRPGRPPERQGPEAQLFDLKTDPGETHNLAGDRPELVRQMTKELERLSNSVLL